MSISLSQNISVLISRLKFWQTNPNRWSVIWFNYIMLTLIEVRAYTKLRLTDTGKVGKILFTGFLIAHEWGIK